MDKTNHPFTIVVIRSKPEKEDLFNRNTYHYHIVATNITDKDNNQLLHWYSQRGEDSENRIKELKSGFAMDYMPCGSFDANAAFFRIGTVAYNLSLLFKKEVLDKKWAKSTITTIRLYIYQIPAKIIRKARKLVLKTTAYAVELFCNMRKNIAPS